MSLAAMDSLSVDSNRMLLEDFSATGAVLWDIGGNGTFLLSGPVFLVTAGAPKNT